MPTYDYHCEGCKHRFELFQSITEMPLKTCPRCGGSVKRLISGGAGLIFKGSGFYITDYKRKGGEKKEGPAEVKGEKKPKPEKGSEGTAEK